MSSPVSLLQHESQLTAVTSQYSLVDTPNLATTRSGRSIISLKDIVQIGGPKAIQAVQQSGNKMQQPNTSSPPAQTLTPIRFTIETSNADGKPGITQPVRDWKNAPMTSGSTQFESDSSPNYSLPTATAANSAFTLSVKVIHSEVVNKSQVASLTQSSSLPSTQKLDSLPIIPSSDRTRSESPTILYQPSVSILDRKADTNSDTPASLVNPSTKTNTLQDSASQPVVSISVSNLQAKPLVQSNYTNEPSASLKSADQVNLREASSQVSNVGLNTIPGQPLSASSIPPSGADSAINVKSGYSYVVSHEDEMEEETPENSQMTVNALGNLAGFGIGTAAAPVSTKPNPFGAVSLNKASSPASSLFTSTASGGELFRLASFSFQPIHPPQPSPPANFGAFPSSFSLTSTSQAPAVTGFGQPAQVGQGQDGLGSILGTFGQSRWVFGVFSTGGGFSSLGLATGAGGFGAAATSAGGFGASATAGGGFVAPIVVRKRLKEGNHMYGIKKKKSVFGKLVRSSDLSFICGGGFGAFSSQQSGGSGFPTFSGSSATARAPSELFTQMRK
ncbi:hypothetical protein KY284_001075 [Solanum tuberosum]|nr:hypothetical protein KY284_001075 [Solanum tuberosum]